jgi:hypothetical protein
VVLPVQVVGYGPPFRAAVLGGGVAAGLSAPVLYPGSIGLFAAMYVRTGARNTVVIGYSAPSWGRVTSSEGLVLAAVASYVLDIHRRRDGAVPPGESALLKSSEGYRFAR